MIVPCELDVCDVFVESVEFLHRERTMRGRCRQGIHQSGTCSDSTGLDWTGLAGWLVGIDETFKSFIFLLFSISLAGSQMVMTISDRRSVRVYSFSVAGGMYR